ncbi:inovirus-type Gp2 protein, partial [Salmonella enterica]|nr:inovirus-type Gp2 protein [Salmonella enterica]
MKTYQGTHGEHILEYWIKINKLLCYLTNRYPRLTAARVDLHYPKIVD